MQTGRGASSRQRRVAEDGKEGPVEEETSVLRAGTRAYVET